MPAPIAAAAAGRAAAGARSASAGSKAAKAAKVRRGAAGGTAGNVAAPTVSDNQALRSELRGRDAVYQAAYEAGQRGEALGDEATDEQRAAWDAGDVERRRARRDRALSTAAGVPSVRGPGFVNDGAGMILGLILYALALNYLQGGAPQARGWIAAKFINKAYEAPAKRGGRVAK